MRRRLTEDEYRQTELEEHKTTALGVFNLRLHAPGWQTGLSVRDIRNYGLTSRAPMRNKSVLSHVQRYVAGTVEKYPLDQHIADLREQGAMWLYDTLEQHIKSTRRLSDESLHIPNPHNFAVPELLESWMQDSATVEAYAQRRQGSWAPLARDGPFPWRQLGSLVEHIQRPLYKDMSRCKLYAVPGHVGVYQSAPVQEYAGLSKRLHATNFMGPTRLNAQSAEAVTGVEFSFPAEALFVRHWEDFVVVVSCDAEGSTISSLSQTRWLRRGLNHNFRRAFADFRVSTLDVFRRERYTQADYFRRLLAAGYDNDVFDELTVAMGNKTPTADAQEQVIITWSEDLYQYFRRVKWECMGETLVLEECQEEWDTYSGEKCRALEMVGRWLDGSMRAI